MRALSVVLHIVLAPVLRCARFRDYSYALGIEGKAYSKKGDGEVGTCRPQVTSVGDFPTSDDSAVQLGSESVCVLRSNIYHD